MPISMAQLKSTSITLIHTKRRLVKLDIKSHQHFWTLLTFSPIWSKHSCFRLAYISRITIFEWAYLVIYSLLISLGVVFSLLVVVDGEEYAVKIIWVFLKARFSAPAQNDCRFSIVSVQVGSPIGWHRQANFKTFFKLILALKSI